jgi:ABC-type ATPase with predicted acetyltransferase domain
MPVLVINQKFHAVGADPSRAAGSSEAVLKTAEMFGIGLDETYEVTLYRDLHLDVRPGDVVFITGPSGSGKSVLLTRLAEALRAARPDETRLVDLAAVDLSAGCAVIDMMGGPLQDRLRTLSTAGLADAFLLLRTPRELSDGQRYRLRLAMAIESLLARRTETTRPASGAANQGVLVADEFCSTLDRLCARSVAYRVRRLADACGVTVLAASAHDDLVEDLAPDVLIIKHEADRVEVRYADPAREVKP